MSGGAELADEEGEDVCGEGHGSEIKKRRERGKSLCRWCSISSRPRLERTRRYEIMFACSRLRRRAKLHCVSLRPLPTHPLRILLVLLVVLRNVRRQRVVRVWCTQQRLYRQQHRPDLQCRRPFICPHPVIPLFRGANTRSAPTFQYIQTDAP